MANYRLYIDESGHHRYKHIDTTAERYLGLTGIIVRQDVYETEVVPRIEALRQPFYTDYDLRPPLHLTDIMAARNDFSALTQPEVRKQFNDEFMALLQEVEFAVITVVIDKNRHEDKYVTPEHPYHYTLACMLERYVKFLKNANAKGDVMVEARGQKEDQLIREVYDEFYQSGTQFADADVIQARLTSGKIKLKTKKFLIHGLEFADLIALSSKLDVLNTNGAIEDLQQNFTKEVIDKLQPRYYSGAMGVNGNGKKFL